MKNGAHVIDMEAMLEGAEVPVTDECCIYRVPYPIRIHKQDAYIPVVVSIGPFHHNAHPRLQNMERHKLSYCKAFLRRTRTTPDTWIRYIGSVESKFRRCYSETIFFTKEELVKIIFVDSGFIFEFLWRHYGRRWLREDVCLSTPWLHDSIRQDMLLLVNQLPFLVLEHLFNISNMHFDNISIHHFTDLLRTFYLPHPPQTLPSRTDDLVIHLPSATELSEAGMKIKVNSEKKCLLDMTFSRGVLRIPQLLVEDRTEILFRNMVALEQCHYYDESYITDYVQMMDFLINTSRDVDILVQ
ncbi:hypothetical protein Fmac_000744 [Flemingia macrophylla]|uniref:Uncharacterized protein n=1 Tax=Flemingia macrophylla TaxID=520843 RepID=A0ABD1NF44_9FABA